MRKPMIVVAILGVVGLAVTSCVSSRARTCERHEMARHGEKWIDNARLRKIMRELDHEVSTYWPQGIEDKYSSACAAKTGRCLEEACWLAEGLVKAADKIPAAVAGIELCEMDERTLLAQTEVLRAQASELEAVACASNLDRMRRVLISIRTTCTSCHDRFRDPARGH